ncbi:TRL domain-containing protein [Leptospira ellisii]|uniref:TRL domain-containing protein n=1 Tax=Leptospira ellisii TaxID=2023197 RepID=A0A2N0B3C0_9LEPT|nr:TRL domain-containing protein [Leptospira ellisii]MDV6235031.1 TRL domain-containing protein [Leptospira ellisii]PJZ91010.1 hypothetical protein CH379_21070 [Leptospira ellisii]PKA04100.1 hypothetical protein CH375_13010 [Leptospira ellisii]
MKKSNQSLRLIFALLVLTFVSANCVSLGKNPMTGYLGFEPLGSYTFPATLDQNLLSYPSDGNIGNKVGMSCVTKYNNSFIIPLFATGDASVQAAADKGDIKKIRYVSFKTIVSNKFANPGIIPIPNIYFAPYSRYCTVVFGD